MSMGRAGYLCAAGRGDRRATAATHITTLFRELKSPDSGICWVHDNAHSPKRYLPETMSAGVAIFDFDGDGCMDIFFRQQRYLRVLPTQIEDKACPVPQ